MCAQVGIEESVSVGARVGRKAVAPERGIEVLGDSVPVPEEAVVAGGVGGSDGGGGDAVGDAG